MKEIERKFLVNSDKWKNGKLISSVRILQGYLSKSPQHNVRIRLKQYLRPKGPNKAVITVKGPKRGLTRDEFEYEIPYADAEYMINTICMQPCVGKTRHTVEDQHKQIWEIDVFSGLNDGLMVAEIELTSETDQVKLPSWVGEEVTHDKRYTNAYLSAHKVE